MRLTLKVVGAGVATTAGVLASLAGVLSYIDDKRDFLRKTPNSKGRSYSPTDLRRRGYSFLLAVRAEGPVGTRLRLRWRLRLDGGDPVPGADYDQTASDFITSALDQTAQVPVWVPDPIASGRYVVRFTFQRLDDKGHVVGFASERDSAPFEHSSHEPTDPGPRPRNGASSRRCISGNGQHVTAVASRCRAATRSKPPPL
jgi:hypothetical protein